MLDLVGTVRRPAVRMCLTLALCFWTWASIRAQNWPSFEVATVKAAVEDRGEAFGILTGGNFQVKAMSLRGLIFVAYNVPREDILGGPGWTDSAKFDIVARPDSSNAGALPMDQYRLRLRSLLADRFQLKLHSETRERAIYNLSRGRYALKLAPVAGNTACDGQVLSMPQFAAFLRKQLQRPVADQTGLRGNYCVRLSWTSDDGKPLGLGVTDTGKGPQATGPSLFTALQEVGLTLQSSKARQNVLVIDGGALPSAN